MVTAMTFRVLWKDASSSSGESFVDFPSDRFYEATEFFLEQMEAGWRPMLWCVVDERAVEVLSSEDVKPPGRQP